MLLSQNYLVCPALRRLYESRCDEKFKVSSLSTNIVEKKHCAIKCSFSKYSENNALVSDECEVIATKLGTSISTAEPQNGIGITNFFRGKNIFITGATGFLGKVLVEKMLRSLSVGKIYILIKAEDSKAAVDRLTNEIINSELFESLKSKHGKFYQPLVREKLIPVVGNSYEPNLGMDSDSVRTIMNDVNVIIGSAANTTLNERYDLSLNTNVNGPQHLLSFAKKCKNIELFVHVSTAYVNGEREGLIVEKPLIMGENRRKDCEESSSSFFPLLNVADEINLAINSPKGSSNYEMIKHMKNLGMERAKLYGWYTTYHLTKAMAEMVINESRGDLPVLIIRPSAILSCFKEPVPGWIQGNRAFDPIILAYGKGQLPAFLGDPNAPMDIVPVDIVTNATIAAIAKHGQMRKSELNVYQIASSAENPLHYSDFFDFLNEYFSSDPLIESTSFTKISYYDNLAKVEYFNNFSDFAKYTKEEISRRKGLHDSVDENIMKELQKQCRPKVVYAQNLCKLYEFLGFFKARFHAGNIHKLSSEMSKEEQLDFRVDIKNLDWMKYFSEIHIPGLRRHVLKDKTV